MSPSSEKIKVFARVRPSKEERVHKVVHATDNDIIVNLDGEEKTFKFDGVFGEDSTQEDVFNVTASRIIQGTLQGYNGTIFAYGQTGSGKTFTMIGPPFKYSQSRSTIFDEESGIIPRGLQSLFELLDKKKEEMPNNFSFNVSVSFIEIHNEHVYDLFAMSEEKLKIGQDYEGNAMVKGTSERIVKDFSDAMTEVKSGIANRKCAETLMNRTSSRSHALLLIKVRTEEVHGSISTARSAFLNLVDLAGSERVKQSKFEGDKLKETASINGSLHQLKNVIREIKEKENKGGYISFRNSALTHILKDSLGGNARTAVIINVHPDKMYYSETLLTLHFSTDLCTIENRVVVNEDLKGDSVNAYKAEIRRLQDEIEKMKGENSEEVAQLQITLEQWMEAANKFERQLAVAKRNTINAAKNGGDEAAALAESVWEKSMREVAESTRKLRNDNKIRMTQLTDELHLARYERDEKEAELNVEKDAKMELQERITRLMSDLALMKSINAEEMEKLKKNFTSNLSVQEKKEVDLNAEIERLQAEIQSKDNELKNKETEKNSVVEVAESIRDKLKKTEADKEKMNKKLESLTAQMHELREEISVKEKKMVEDWKKSEEEQKKVVSALKRQLEEMRMDRDEYEQEKEQTEREDKQKIDELTAKVSQLELEREDEEEEEISVKGEEEEESNDEEGEDHGLFEDFGLAGDNAMADDPFDDMNEDEEKEDKGRGDKKKMKKNRRVLHRNSTPLECVEPNCPYVTRSAKSWADHLRTAHFTRPNLAGVVLRCGCGKEVLSNMHTRKGCPIADYTVIRKRDGPIRRIGDAKDTPRCCIAGCEEYPSTPIGYYQHLQREHQTTLIKEGIYLKCGKLKITASRSVYTAQYKSLTQTDLREFTLHKVEEKSDEDEEEDEEKNGEEIEEEEDEEKEDEDEEEVEEDDATSDINK